MRCSSHQPGDHTWRCAAAVTALHNAYGSATPSSSSGSWLPLPILHATVYAVPCAAHLRRHTHTCAARAVALHLELPAHGSSTHARARRGSRVPRHCAGLAHTRPPLPRRACASAALHNPPYPAAAPAPTQHPLQDLAGPPWPTQAFACCCFFIAHISSAIARRMACQRSGHSGQLILRFPAVVWAQWCLRYMLRLHEHLDITLIQQL